MGKLNMKLMQGVAEAEQQIQKEKQTDSKNGKVADKAGDTGKVSKISPKTQSNHKQSGTRRKNTQQSQKTANEPNMKSQKQVFSFRATVSDISIWKTYAIASGRPISYITVAAMNEFMQRHKLSDVEQTVFEALKAREEDRE